MLADTHTVFEIRDFMCPSLGHGVCNEAVMRLRIRTFFQIHNHGLGCGPVRIVFPQFHWRQGKGFPPSFTSFFMSSVVI